jgi:hypothetical protein
MFSGSAFLLPGVILLWEIFSSATGQKNGLVSSDSSFVAHSSETGQEVQFSVL